MMSSVAVSVYPQPTVQKFVIGDRTATYCFLCKVGNRRTGQYSDRRVFSNTDGTGALDKVVRQELGAHYSVVHYELVPQSYPF